MDESKVILIYTGAGAGASVDGVPACNITEDLIAQRSLDVEALLALRHGDQPLYVRVEDYQPPEPVVVIDPNDGLSEQELSDAGHVLASGRK